MRWLVVLGLLAAACGCGGPKKPPYSPREALNTFQLPPDFRIELVASEPDVVSPVALAFDEQGRLFVVEMPDYPLDPKPRGRIKLLEDRDGDGRYERSTVFADGLSMPDGVMRWRNGILVTSAPDILYFEDTNGDGKADVRRVVLTGFAATNPQLRLNGLQYGIDNWIYAAYPRVPTPRRYVKEFGDPGKAVTFPDRPDIAPLDVRSNDIRFHPEHRKLESISGNSQFGNAFDSWGNRFTVWNNDHLRHPVIDRRYLGRNTFLAVQAAMQSVSDHENSATVYPVTKDPFHIHDTQIGHFTSACGISVYTGGNLPGEFEGSSFTCEPVHNLVHRDVLVRKGATFVAKRAYDKREFLASTDAWFRPVFTATGPDGALYVVDFYRFTVEHPEYVPPELLKQIDFEPKQPFGRIWRVLHRTSRPARKPNLDKAPPTELVTHLANANMWWRIQAQRLLVDRKDHAVVSSLAELARKGETPQSRIHALWTLDGLGAMSNDLVLAALNDPHPHVREHGIRFAEQRLTDAKLRSKVIALADDPDDRVQFQVACSLVEPFEVVKKILLRHLDDQWFQIAALSGSADKALAWYRMGLALAPSKGRDELLRRSASVIGGRKNGTEIAAVLGSHTAAGLDGLADGLRQGGRLQLGAAQHALLRALADPTLAKPALRVASAVELVPSAELQGLVAEASRMVASPEKRVQALRLMGLDPAGSRTSLIAEYLSPKHPDEVQLAAAEALSNVRKGEVTQLLIERWRTATGPVRNVILAAFFNDRSRIPALLDAIQAEKIQPWALGPGRSRQLLYNSDPAIKSKARAVLGENAMGARKAVFQKYLPAIRSAGNPERGREVFERDCAECHKIGNTGFEVGPDLRSVTTRYKEALLADILLPNQAIETGYEEYLVETTDGRSLSGVLAKETPASLTLRRAKGEEDTVLRSSVKELRSLSVSPMPEDLEKKITVDEMADLIAYIKNLK
jgi:putative membrane-bound dehydrogenase-like protein